MATKAMKVGYRLVRNGTSTADRAPYLGVAVPIGSLAYDNILQRMLNRGTFMTRATAQYFLNAFYEFAAEKIADDVVRINMGAVSLYPMIGGSFDSEDGEDESLALVAADGLTKVADITVVSTEDGQRIVCTLASAVPAGTYYVRLVSHGLDPTAPLVTALHKVTVKAASRPEPAPIATSYEADGDAGGPITMDDSSLHVNGTNLADATSVLFRYSEDGEPFYEADPTEVTDTMVDCGSLGYSGEVESANGYLSVVTPKGESNKLPCTFAV